MRCSATTYIVLSLLTVACGDSAETPTALPRAASVAVTAVDVTSIVDGADAFGNLLLTRSDNANAYGSAAYTNINKITSKILADGSWQLYLGAQTARTLYLVLASQGIAVPDGYYSKNVEAFAKCFDQNNVQVSLLAMGAGTSNGNCSFGVDFLGGRTKYKLVMGSSYAGTGRATVTCAASNGSCTSWTIKPNPDAASTGVANLYHYDSRGRLVFDGVYRNTYSVSVAR